MKIGLKVWASNIQYVAEARKLVLEGFCDFLEIYINSDCKKEDVNYWKGFFCPICLHAPHSYGGFNPGKAGSLEEKRKILEKVEYCCQELNPKYIIFHPGIDGTIKESIRQYKVFKRDFSGVFQMSLIENKPKVGLNGEFCLGASPQEIKEMRNHLGFGFCLDVAHAICYAAWAGEKWEIVLEEFLLLRPQMIHLSDGYVNSVKDTHLHFGKGNYDFIAILSKFTSEFMITIETPHDFLDQLKDFKEDVLFLRRLL